VHRWEGIVTPKTLANWRHNKQPPSYVKIGGKVAYRLEDIEEYERDRKITIAK